MSHQNKFGSAVRQFRKDKNLSQRDLAEKVRMDFTYLSKIENGHMDPPSLGKIIKIADILDTSEDELIALAGKVPPEMGDALVSNESARRFNRLALEMKLTKSEWDQLMIKLEKLRQ